MTTATGHRASLRERYTAFIARHEVAWELVMAALAVCYVVIGFTDAPPGAAGWVQAIEDAITVIFVLEFATRFLATRTKRAYLRGHWVDLFALLPTARGVRLLRLLRLLRLIRAFAGMYRALARFERLAGHGRLVWLFVAWLAVAVISSAALFVAEAGVNPNVDEPIDALWWGVVTLTTVGYGDVYPVTPEGRLAGAGLMILGITLFAAITGTITSFLVRQEATSSGPQETLETLRRLGDLRALGLVSEDEFQEKKTELLARL